MRWRAGTTVMDREQAALADVDDARWTADSGQTTPGGDGTTR
jgi:hypothetical protein